MYKGLIAFALLCMLVIPAFASAHTSKVTAVCVDNRISVTFDYKDFNKKLQASSAESVFVDTVSAYDSTFSFKANGNHTVTLDGNYYGSRAIEARSLVYQDNKEWSAVFLGNVVCGDEPETPPTTTTTPPKDEVTPPPVDDNPPVVEKEPKVKPSTNCADLRANGAGIKWLKKFGCVKPKPNTSCDYLLDHGAAKKWLDKYNCVVKISTRKYNPPVTG
jgi:hypothetical protein